MKIILLIFFFDIFFLSAGFTQNQDLIPFRKGNLWGYSNASGEIIIEPRYEQTYLFSCDGIARVKNKGLYGYIDADGKLIVIPRYSEASDFYMGIAEVTQRDKKFCINLDGEISECNPPDYDVAYDEDPPPNPFTSIKDSIGNHHLVYMISEDTIATAYDSIRIIERYFFPTLNYFALISENGLWGAYNEQGMLAVTPEFEALDIFDMKTYKGMKNNLWGVRNFANRTLIPFEYDSIIKVNEMLFEGESLKKKEFYIVGKNKKYGVINDRNITILPLVYDEIKIPEHCNCESEFIISQNGMVGLANGDGKIILPLKYRFIKPFAGAGYTLIKTINGKEGYVDRSGMEYFTD